MTKAMVEPTNGAIPRRMSQRRQFPYIDATFGSRLVGTVVSTPIGTRTR